MSFNPRSSYAPYLLFFFSLLFFQDASAFPLEETQQSLQQSVTEYLDALDRLEDHINEVAVMSDAELATNHEDLTQNVSVLESDLESVEKSFEIVALFEEKTGPLFTTSNTRNGVNRALANDGLNLHRNIIVICQGLIDHVYKEAWLKMAGENLDGKFFRTSEYFPGLVDPPADSEAIETAKIRCSYQLGSGSQPWATIGNDHVVRPTGCYLAPGSIAEVVVPDSLVGKGIRIRVGAHFWNLESKNKYKRFDRVSILYDINETTTKVANPLGGGIYIELPLGVDEGIVDIQLKNVVRAPFFSQKTFHKTTLEEWVNIERNHPAPWTDFETDKFMLQVPTSWIYAFDDPESLLEDWDKSMDAISDLLGRPRIVDRHKNYLQFDVIIRGSAYHPGYPMSNTPYNPHDATDGTPKHNILKGPQFGQDIHFHEIGHEVAISKFVGETEAIVNFLYVPVLNRCFGYSLDEAFQKSFGPSYNYFETRQNTVKNRLVASTFCEGIPRNTCNCTKNEVRYQQRGYAHYADIVELYGWEALEKFWKSESDAADMGIPFPVNNQEQDDRIFRMSLAAGVDLRPLFHFWGIHPMDQDALAQKMMDNNLRLPMLIKEKLHQYETMIPGNYDEFVSFAQELYPDFLNYSGNQFDYGPGWYKVRAESYDESKAMQIQQALSDIIVLYYGTDCFEVEAFSTPEFTLDMHYCQSDIVLELPSISENEIRGSWLPDELDVTQTGTKEYTFYPDLEECALEYSTQIEVTNNSVEIIGETTFCFGDSVTLFTDPYQESFAWTVNGQSVVGEQSAVIYQGGEVNLVVVDSLGCTAEAQLMILQSDEIQVDIEVVHPVCYGETGSAQFSGDSYTYSMSGDSLFAGMYSLVATDSLGCSHSFEFEINEPDPILIFLEDGTFEVEGGVPPYTITVDTLENVQTAYVTDANGCMVSETFFYSGIQVQEIIERIFPNPASDQIKIEMSEVELNIQSMQLFSMDGQLLKNFNIQERLLDISEVNAGTYYLSIELVSGNTVNKKIVILK